MRQITKKSGLLFLVLVVILLCAAPAANALKMTCPLFCMDTIDGKQVSNETIAGKATLIIFLHISTDLESPDVMLNTVVHSDLLKSPNLNVIVADCMGTSLEDIRQTVYAKYGKDTGITFCSGDLWSFLMAADGGTSYSLPACFLIDADGYLCSYVMGSITDISLRKLLSGHIPEIAPNAMLDVSIEGEELYDEAYEVLRILNAEREKNGLSPLKMDKALLEAAMLRAAECAVYYSHTRPNGESCFTAFPAGGYSQAENIAMGYGSAADVMDGWMNSPGHRKNILTADFASVGIGVFCHNGCLTWTQLFCSNEAETVTAPANKTVTATVQTLGDCVTVRLNPRQLLLKKGDTRSVDLQFYYGEILPNWVNLSSSCLTYRSENPAIAKVNSEGVVTAVEKGTTRITVSLKGSDLSASFSVTVGDHTCFESVPKEPTCAEPGTGEYVCEECGDLQTLEIPKLTTHTWDDGKVTRQPTKAKEGVRTYTCTVCAGTKQESIPKLTQTSQPAPKPTTAPTQAPTAAPTKAPTVPATKAPTAAPTQAPTAPSALAPTLNVTQPSVQTEPTAEVTTPTEPTQAPTNASTAPSESVATPTEPAQSAPATESTQLPTQTENPPEKEANSGLWIGLAAAAAVLLAVGAGFLLRKRKD